MTRRQVLVGEVGSLLFALSAAVTIAAQAPAVAPLVVNGNVTKPLSLMPEELKKLPRSKVELKAEDGTVSVYEGVMAGELLRMAGVPLNGQMRGPAITSYVVATAADGFQAVFGLADFDSGLTASDILVADTMNGKPLQGNQGPLRLVAPKDRRNTRSVRMLQRLEVVGLKKQD